MSGANFNDTSNQAATEIPPPNKRYVDFISGDDTNGNGSLTQPWKTVNHAYANISPSINEPYAIYISGGNNDSDGPITAKPNVSLIADYPIQISPAFTISGGTSNDGVTFQNIIFVGQFTWVRNDNTFMGFNLVNTEFFAGPNVQQQGAGSLFVTAVNSTFVNSQWKMTSGGVFTACSFLGTTTFDDVSNAAYYEILGGYNDGAMTINGAPEVYFNGFSQDAPFGAAINCVTTTNGSPTIQADSGSLLGSITGTFTLNKLSFAKYEAYTAGTPGNWAGSAPTDVNTAIDRMSALLKTLNSNNPIP